MTIQTAALYTGMSFWGLCWPLSAVFSPDLSIQCRNGVLEVRSCFYWKEVYAGQSDSVPTYISAHFSLTHPFKYTRFNTTYFKTNVSLSEQAIFTEPISIQVS